MLLAMALADFFDGPVFETTALSQAAGISLLRGWSLLIAV
jgi:hypothetical protein